MHFKSGPFVIAAGVGAAIQFLVAMISTVVSYFSLAPFLTGVDAGDVDQTPFLVMSAISGLMCLCVLLLDLLVGAGYSLAARRSGEVDVGDGAIGGLFAALVARLVSGLFGTVVSVAVTALMFNQLAVAPGNVDPSAIVLAAGGGAVGGLIGVCIGAVVGAMLGAMGGGVTAAIVRRSGA
ncbi:MAG: hypothetical protein ACT4QE_11555 [Anaerolineales bacterium]